jgi:hypothetical protein
MLAAQPFKRELCESGPRFGSSEESPLWAHAEALGSSASPARSGQSKKRCAPWESQLNTQNVPKKMSRFARAAVLMFAVNAVGGCGEWNSYLLVKDETKQVAGCAVHWGKLSPEDTQRLHQCIAACQQKGFRLSAPDTVPPLLPTSNEVSQPSIPVACQG